MATIVLLNLSKQRKPVLVVLNSWLFNLFSIVTLPVYNVFKYKTIFSNPIPLPHHAKFIYFKLKINKI